MTLQHLLTHVSGLPNQLPENDMLRKKHVRSVNLLTMRFALRSTSSPVHVTNIPAWRSFWRRVWQKLSAGSTS